jgi:hypothetical protein
MFIHNSITEIVNYVKKKKSPKLVADKIKGHGLENDIFK